MGESEGYSAVQIVFGGGLGSQTRGGGGGASKGQVYKRWRVVLYVPDLGPVVCPQANVQHGDGNVAMILGKRLVTATWESVDWRFGWAASSMAAGRRAWGLIVSCLSVLTTWQLASSRVSDPSSASERVKQKSPCLFWPSLEEMEDIPSLLQAAFGHTDQPDAGLQGTAGEQENQEPLRAILGLATTP